MSQSLIVLGDKTTHGGTVISADNTFDVYDKPAARVGDMTVCPKCKGTFPITSGASDFIDPAGRGYARHMDTTACGAKLICSQSTAYWSAESSIGDPAFAETAALPSSVASETPTLCLECLVSAAARGDGVVTRG